MRITFVLPDFVSVPVGGIKVLYELANGLARRGHKVTVLHFDTLGGASRSVRLRHAMRFAAFRRGLGGWFRLDRTVATGLIDPDRPGTLVDGDVLIAGRGQVAPFVTAHRHRQARVRISLRATWALEGDPSRSMPHGACRCPSSSSPAGWQRRCANWAAPKPT